MSPLVDRRVPWILVVLFLGLSARALAADQFLHDEGLLAELFAGLVARDPLPAIFMQKVRPPIAILHAPAAALGQATFFWMHVGVAALSIPLLAAAARRLGHGAPNVAAAVVALSPMMLAAGAAGVSNADAVTGVCLVVWLLSSGRHFAAGVVMGALVWVRSELAVIALATLGLALAMRRPRLVLGLAVWPLVYGTAGAAYHGDLLWMLHLPPALPEPMPDNPFWAEHPRAPGLGDLAATLASISPLVILVPLVSVRRLGAIERWLGAGTVVLAVALVLLPRWQVFNFDQSPRYLLPVLPLLALAVARVAEAGWGGNRVTGAWLVVAAALAVAAHRLGGPLVVVIAVLVIAGTVAFARRGRTRLAGGMLLALLATGPGPFVAGARLDRSSEVPHLDEIVARLREREPELDRRAIYTNEPVLAAYLRRGGALPGARVIYLVQADQAYELTTLTNPANGQRAAIRAALRQGFYGTPIFPDELDPGAIPEGALFVLTRDPRLELVMPQARWAERLHVLHPGRAAIIAELRAPPGRRR